MEHKHQVGDTVSYKHTEYTTHHCEMCKGECCRDYTDSEVVTKTGEITELFEDMCPIVIGGPVKPYGKEPYYKIDGHSVYHEDVL